MGQSESSETPIVQAAGVVVDVAELSAAARDLERLSRQIFAPIQRGADLARRVVAAEGAMKEQLRQAEAARLAALAAEAQRDARVAACAADVARAEAERDRAQRESREVIQRLAAERRTEEKLLSEIREQLRQAEEQIEALRRHLQQG
jgi:chromosome segregation ATPase